MFAFSRSFPSSNLKSVCKDLKLIVGRTISPISMQALGFVAQSRPVSAKSTCACQRISSAEGHVKPSPSLPRRALLLSTTVIPALHAAGIIFFYLLFFRSKKLDHPLMPPSHPPYDSIDSDFVQIRNLVYVLTLYDAHKTCVLCAYRCEGCRHRVSQAAILARFSRKC